ncbi:hypothetical protein EX30DRAFT_340624 [Ascodesmis nigricans]|uniref:Opioid growth factor receptor (OGFr) conserved domain-containing protein n=1 Tax=Ascodesmis nigricans TaxID=341454 RepID=A0A4S2MYD0_9PEZI|nr:hypothetical protein EX30DRAFT_340624 [Ascodesmis nigricans]
MALPDRDLEGLHDYIQWIFPLPERSVFNPWAPVVGEDVVGAFRGCEELREGVRDAVRRVVRFWGFEVGVREEEEDEDEDEGEEREKEKEKENDDGEKGQDNVESDDATKEADLQPSGDKEEEEGRKEKKKQEEPTIETPSPSPENTLNSPPQKPTKRTITITPPPNALSQLGFQNWWRRFDHNHLRMTRMIRSLRILGLEDEAQAFYQALLKAKEMFPRGPGKTSYMFWARAAKRPLEIPPEDD